MLLNIRHIVGAVLLFIRGLVKLIGECKDFYELEKGIHALCQQVSIQIFTWALEEIDDRLKNERDPKIWEIVGFRTKTALSTFGEFTYKRRMYRNKETGETKFFLDELLGWPARAKITPRLRELAVKLSTEMPFRKAAEILSYLVPPISAMTVWQILQEVGKTLQKEGEEKRAAIFERGEAPAGKETAPELYIEADGVIIPLQKGKEKRGEIKHIIAYEGKKEISPGRWALKNKLVISSIDSGTAAWEESCALISQKWDLSQTRRIIIGGDGAAWPKQGREYFLGAEYRLDPYHLNKHLVEALCFNGKAYQEVSQAICAGDWVRTQKALTAAIRNSRGKQKEKINKLYRYLEENWEGIVSAARAQSLGAIEGQIQHNIARRMKRLGARWTIAGGDRMARLLAAKANGELGQHTAYWAVNHKKLKEIAETKKADTKRETKKQAAEDIEKWLRVSMPALRGPFAGEPWIKYILREISRLDGSVLAC